MLGRRASLIGWMLFLFAAVFLGGRPSLARDYVIASGDSVSINVAGETTYSRSYTVKDDGTIFITDIGTVAAVGKTTDQLKDDLIARFKTILKNPIITVDVANPTNYVVWVTGEVGSPKSYPIQPDAHIMDVLQKAGGIKDTGDRKKAKLFRRGETIDLDLEALYKDADLSKNIPVEMGDTIYIPKKVEGKYKVLGEVNTPGEKDLKADAHIMDVLQDAGGIKDTGDRKRATLQRGGQTIPLDLEALYKNADLSKNIAVEADDVIYIPKKAEGKVKVLGEVGKPGDIDMKLNLTPFEAITLSGGFKDSADKGAVVVQHKDGSRVEVDLDAEARGDDSPLTKNLYLQEDDTVFVPNNKNTRVTVSGPGVKSPGEFTYEPGMTVMDAVTRAGGFDENAKRKTVHVVHKAGGAVEVNMDKFLSSGDTSQNLALQKDDTVVVDKSAPKDPNRRNPIVDSVLATLPTLLLWRVIYR